MEWDMRSERGTVLVLVLWVLSLLTLIGGFYAVEARIRRNLGQQAWDSVAGREAVRALLVLASTRVAPPGANREQAAELGLFVTDGTEYTVNLGEGSITFSLEDEQGKLDLNKSSEAQIREVVLGILQSEEPETGDTIVDSILDWRDSDDLVRFSGAEDDVYQERSPAYLPANSPFRSVEELLLVNGVTHALYYGPIPWRSEGENAEEPEWQGGLRDIFTVYNKSSGVVKDYAPLPLQELLGTEGQAGGRDALCLKARWASQTYRIYWKPETAAGKFRILQWQETATAGDQELKWSENGK